MPVRLKLEDLPSGAAKAVYTLNFRGLPHQDSLRPHSGEQGWVFRITHYSIYLYICHALPEMTCGSLVTLYQK